MKIKFEIDKEGLKKYLSAIDYKEIETDWNKTENTKLKSAVLIEDVEYFNMDRSKVPLDRFVDYGDVFLVDALGNDLSILLLTKKKYRLPTGRVVNAKLLDTVVSDCRAQYGTPLNGCWKIPNQFIKAINKQ